MSSLSEKSSVGAENSSNKDDRSYPLNRNDISVPLAESSHGTGVKRRLFTHALFDEKTSEAALKKAITTICYGLMTSLTTWETSIYASVIPDVSGAFGVSEVVATLGTSLFLVGLGLGPLLWAPLSEIYGRKLGVLPQFFIGAIFAFASATAQDFQTLMITRFFGGFFSSAPLVNTGGVLADLYTPKQRATAMAGYQMSVVGGPLVAPIIGGAISDSSLTWRWTEYITGIMMLCLVGVNTIVIDETYSNALLVSKARWLRYESGNWALHAKHEEWNVSLNEMARKYLVKPFQLLWTPICFAMCLYSGIPHRIPRGARLERPGRVGSLPFLGVLIGCFIGAGLNVAMNIFYLKKFAANNNRPVPEARLLPMMFGGFALAAGLFIFGWTSSKNIPWIGSVIGTVLLGGSFIMIFQAAMNYLVDTFQANSASAVAANTVIRSLLAAGFPLFTSAMFHDLGIAWASSVLGFVAVAMIPIPFLFYVFGQRIRARGKWSRPSTE